MRVWERAIFTEVRWHSRASHRRREIKCEVVEGESPGVTYPPENSLCRTVQRPRENAGKGP